MTDYSVPDESVITGLTGHRFPGGSYTVEHWENALLTECTGAELLPNDMVHPVALFHMPIFGAGTSIAEMFALGQAESDLSIMIESYDWEIFIPLKEEICYSISGEISSAERRNSAQLNVHDRIQFRFEIHNPEKIIAARSTITWLYTRNTL